MTVSTDGGKKWQILKGHTTDEESGGQRVRPRLDRHQRRRRKTPKWVEEQVDLTPYAGKQILLRFENVTDDAVNGPGSHG